MDRTGIDYPVLVATLQAWQLSTETARAERRCATPGGGQGAKEPGALTQILLAGQDWQQAVLAQGGSFNRLFARFAEGA
ncbi:MAG TPA: hypothetical protein VGR19_09420 [Allosphingosinicella sp.]|nr:hypothetical protein [Allosphingosinicella sp.]